MSKCVVYRYIFVQVERYVLIVPWVFGVFAQRVYVYRVSLGAQDEGRAT